LKKALKRSITFDSSHSPNDKDFTYSIINPFEDLAAIDEEGELIEGDAIDTTCLSNLAEEYTQDIIQELKVTITLYASII